MDYSINEYTSDEVLYRAKGAEELKKDYISWMENLTNDEKKAIRKYRRKLCLKNNINAKLRKGKETEGARLISAALKKANTPENIIVYRNLSRIENEQMAAKEINKTYKWADFKGTHAGTNIKGISKKDYKGGYMLILVPQNTNAAYINDLTICFRDEREFLIDKEQSFVLIEKMKSLRNGYVVKIVLEDAKTHKENKTL